MTYTLESAFVRAYAASAVAVQAVLDATRKLNELTRRRPGSYTSMEPDFAHNWYGFPEDPLHGRECIASDGGTWVFDALGGGLWDAMTYPPDAADDTPNPTEPGLDDDELIGVRGLLQERYEDRACTCPSWGNPNWPHRHGCPADPPPTIASAAPQCAVDGEGPASVCDIQPSPEAGQPTSGLLTNAACAIELWLGGLDPMFARESWEQVVAELRDRAATFTDIEQDN